MDCNVALPSDTVNRVVTRCQDTAKDIRLSLAAAGKQRLVEEITALPGEEKNYLRWSSKA